LRSKWTGEGWSVKSEYLEIFWCCTSRDQKLRVRCRKSRTEAGARNVLSPPNNFRAHRITLEALQLIFQAPASYSEAPPTRETSTSEPLHSTSFLFLSVPLFPCMLRAGTRSLSLTFRTPSKHHYKPFPAFPRLSPPLALSHLPNYSTYSSKMTPSSTAFCKALNLKHPIVCPPMANCAGGILSAEVSKAGGLGLVGQAVSPNCLEDVG